MFIIIMSSQHKVEAQSEGTRVMSKDCQTLMSNNLPHHWRVKILRLLQMPNLSQPTVIHLVLVLTVNLIPVSLTLTQFVEAPVCINPVRYGSPVGAEQREMWCKH